MTAPLCARPYIAGGVPAWQTGLCTLDLGHRGACGHRSVEDMEDALAWLRQRIVLPIQGRSPTDLITRPLAGPEARTRWRLRHG